MSFEGQFYTPLLIELVVEGHYFYGSFDTSNGSINPNISIESFIIDVFDH